MANPALLLLLASVAAQDYTGSVSGLGGRLELQYGVAGDRFQFQLTGRTRGWLGLALSYSEQPQDGLVVGVRDGRVYSLDLAPAPGSAGIQTTQCETDNLCVAVETGEKYRLVKDDLQNVVLEGGEESENLTVVRGSRPLDNLADPAQDLSLTGAVDIM